jgi:predicted small lipoprotein YifL
MIVKSPAARVLLVAGVVVLSLAACGRRGPPEPPPSAAATAVEPVPAAAPGPAFGPPVPGARQDEDLQQLPSVPDRPFILDALL